MMASSTFHYLFLFLLLACTIPKSLSSHSPSKQREPSPPHERGETVPDYFLYVDETLPKVNSLDEDDISTENDLEIHPRWKRDADDYQPSWKVVGAGQSKTIKKLATDSKRMRSSVKMAIENGNFSEINSNDMDSVDIPILEHIPPTMFQSMSPDVKNKVVDMLLTANRPNALARFLEANSKQLDFQRLSRKISIEYRNAKSIGPNEAASILLYTAAINSLGNESTDQATIALWNSDKLLKYVPEELFMKIRQPDAARTLVSTLYQGDVDAENNNIDDKALIYRLIEVGHGSAQTFTLAQMDNLLPKFYAGLPYAFLKRIPVDIVKARLRIFKTVEFGTPLQRKAVTDAYLASSGIDTNNKEGAPALKKNTNVSLSNLAQELDTFSAFINPGLTQDENVLKKVVEACNSLKLPAPVKAVQHLIKQRLRGKQIRNLNRGDFQYFKGGILNNAPPNVIRHAITTKEIDSSSLQSISEKVEESSSNSYLKGLVSQLGKYAVDEIRDVVANIHALPPAFLNAIGISKILQIRDSEGLQTILAKLNKSQDSLDDIQKGILIGRLRSYGLLKLDEERSNIPPTIAALIPRTKNKRKIVAVVINGLPSESDLRLAYGEQKKQVSVRDLEDQPLFVGTLTPLQVKAFSLDDIPAVLATIRKSTDGPSSHTLKVLSERFADYIRNKSADTETIINSKLLKYVSAAEVSRIPATVLAYFIDSHQVRKLPDQVRKELLIALGTLSTKDHALIPSRTREEMILQGLEVMDKHLEHKDVYDVPEVAALAHGVVDLPPDRIRKLSPVALELALDVVQGNVDDDDDGLRQRACLKPEQRYAWRSKIIEAYGDPSNWTPATVTSLCCSLALLEEGDLRKITKESIVTCKCISDERPPSHLKNLRQALNGACAYELGRPATTLDTLNRVQAAAALDIEDLEEQSMNTGHHSRAGRRRRRNRRDGGYSVQGQDGESDGLEDDTKKLRCTSLRLIGSAAGYSREILNTFWEKEIHDCLYELGVDPLDTDPARILWIKLTNMHDKNVKQISSYTMRKAGYILRGITKAEIEQLDFNNDDIVAPLGASLGLPKSLLEHMSTHLEHKKNKQWEQFSDHEIIVAGNIICGADVQRLMKLDPVAFSNSLPHLKNLHQSCDFTRLAVLANIATNPQVFGDPSGWTAADVRGLGMIFKGLSSKEVVKIQPEAFLGLSPSAAANLVRETLQVLSPAQVSHIPRFSALAMMREQIEHLMPEAREILESNKKGSLVSSTTTNKLHSAVTIWTILTLLLTALFAQRVL